MKVLPAIEGGLTGAVALTLVHETVRRIYPDAPRMDLIGMTALAKILSKAGETPPAERKLYWYTMAGDVASNALFYSIAGLGKKKGVLQRGIALGLAAGIGAVVLPKHMNLPDRHSNRTPATVALTIGIYLLGGVVAAGVMKLLEEKSNE